MLILFGPMVAAFLIPAAMPADIRYVVALAIAVVLCGWMALAPLPPSAGPDDWYRGIGRAGGLMGLFGAVATIPAQAARSGYIPATVFEVARLSLAQ